MSTTITNPASSLPYAEPATSLLLTLASFLILLNTLSSLLDLVLPCGLLAQILVGALFGASGPTPAWLPPGVQTAVQQLGYQGIVMGETEAQRLPMIANGICGDEPPKTLLSIPTGENSFLSSHQGH
jgi:hypothetical protein